MWGSRCRVFLSLAFLLAVASLNGCVTPSPDDTRWSRHFEPEVWGGALGEQVNRPDRIVPEAALLAAIPLSFIYDDQVRDFSAPREVNQTAKTASDALQIILPAVPAVMGTIDWAHGDGGRHLEVAAEALAATTFMQQLLAHTVSRTRPNGSDDHTSFPSGHTSWAFAATTLIVRNIHDPSNETFYPTDALLYVPAAFVAWERTAANKHWTSDVVCGALLGVFLTNWIWDAHFGSEGEDRHTVFKEDRPHGITWSPNVEVASDGRVVFGIKGGF